ncbi:RNA polymerase factor sigma-54 [Shewanella glacialimarina]|jgi:RNA polymerase sigma-54 factor|uniref:RNA polymerase factor sigma-54 n=1 Tax=Shewanella glacialimarina TaxID=2590884 RepID=UPI001CF8C20F|nr:RNA polymerase factor sigma-54 [Shewanella glacialimarina]UCX06057.1 RNA polymerase factor sigma-54 [Shewanella glacialimarina]
MKASLQLKMGQHLTMTPQLQQAIRLLQLSSLELQQEIQQVLDSNPLLEMEDEFSALSNKNDNSKDLSETDFNEISAPVVEKDTSNVDTAESMTKEQMSEDLPMDTTWDEVYSASPMASPGSGSGSMPNDDMPFQGETSEGLYEHLEWQKNLTPFSETDLAIATAIIDAIDDTGYLTQSTEDILEAMGDDSVELDEVEAVLKRIQHFDPLGVASRSLSECLLIQLVQFAPDTPHIDNARILIKDYLDLIAGRDFRTLMRKTKLKEDELREAIELIQSLNPRPGTMITPPDDEYVIPDVSVTKKNGRWVVELNPDNMPKIGINQQYAAMAKSSKSSTDTQFIRGHLQEAKWFIKSLESRSDTLLKVSNCIVQFQQGFFEYGAEAMKPMVLNDIAEAVEMHESTISRVTTQKYMHTPRGLFELKYFFSSHVSTDDGGECSSTAIRAFIKKLVAAENQRKPLSDSKMADLLAEQGINVARRTIAKYREAMMIPPSNQRKSL